MGTFKQYFGNPSPSALPTDEITALNFLKDKPRVPSSLSYDPMLKLLLPPQFLFMLMRLPTMSPPFSHHLTFLEDEMNLENSGYDWQPRRKQSLDFFKQEKHF